MKIICSRESLFYGLQIVQKAVSNRSNMPIYNGILFEVNGDKLHLFATDLEIGIDCYIPTKVEEEGSVVMPQKTIIELIRKLPEEEVTIESSDGVSTIKTKKSKYEIVGFLGNDFSAFPKIEPIISVRMAQKELKKAIEKVIFAVSKGEQRAFLNGASFKLLKDKLEIVATDSHCLASNKCDVIRIGQSNIDEHETIVTQKTLMELLKLLDDDDETFVNINMGERQILFVLYPEESKKSIRIYSRLIEGRFPDYNQIVPKSFSSEIIVNNKSLKETIERVSLFTEIDVGRIDILVNAIKEGIKLENECEMVLNSETANLGKATEQIICFNKGDDSKITVNCKYILDVLNIIETENTIIKMVDESSPMVIVPENDKDYLYIVMPIIK